MPLKLDTPCQNLLRALMPLVYVRTSNPEALQQDYNDVLFWSVYGTTEPNLVHPHPPLPTAEDEGRVRKRKIEAINLYKNQRRLVGVLPANVIEHLMTKDPFDEEGLGVITITDASTISGLAEEVKAFYNRRHTDFRWGVMLVFVGTLPAKQAIPEAMWNLFYPIDLVEGTRTEGVDPRPRPEAATLKAIRKAFKLVAEYCDMKPNPDYPETPETYEPFAGMTVFDVHQVVALSILYTRLGGPCAAQPDEKFNAFVRMLNRPTIDAYKNRWARIA